MTRPLIGITTSDRKSRLAWFFDWLAGAFLCSRARG